MLDLASEMVSGQSRVGCAHRGSSSPWSVRTCFTESGRCSEGRRESHVLKALGVDSFDLTERRLCSRSAYPCTMSALELHQRSKAVRAIPVPSSPALTSPPQINLNAGPSSLPLAALLTASSSLISYDQSGMGVAELSHRSAAFQAIIDQGELDLRALLEIPSNYKVLWMQGGGLTQFSATALNLLAAYRLKHKTDKDEEVVGEYVVTGSWSLKAAEEGERMGLASRTIIDGRKDGSKKFTCVPQVAQWDLRAHSGNEARKPAFVYYCDNETVDGVEFATDAVAGGQPFPFDAFAEDVPIVCDMSSNFLSRPVDVSRYGVIYAGAQKNLGPSGVTVVIVREDLLGTSPFHLKPHPVDSRSALPLQSTATSRSHTVDLESPQC
jgi:phosphoserine aminotransferase